MGENHQPQPHAILKAILTQRRPQIWIAKAGMSGTNKYRYKDTSQDLKQATMIIVDQIHFL